MTTVITYSPAQVSAPPVMGLPDLVGNTPLLHLRSLTADLSPRVQIYAKAEWFNPGGSIKDRPALNIIRTALAEGRLGGGPRGGPHGGRRLLDATSGNTGIAYATFSAAFGIDVTLAMPANASPERISILRALGVELILTDPAEGTDGAVRKVHELAAQTDRYFHANQYDNPANWQAHYLTTAPEIVHQTGGSLTHFVAGMGTSGTMTGVGRFMRQYNPEVQLAAVQPDSPFHGMEGFKHMATAILPGIYDPTLADRVIEVQTESAYEMALRLARQEGLFVGISAAANALAARRLAQELEAGVIVTIFPDAGYKYLSDKKLWEGME